MKQLSDDARHRTEILDAEFGELRADVAPGYAEVQYCDDVVKSCESEVEVATVDVRSAIARALHNLIALRDASTLFLEFSRRGGVDYAELMYHKLDIVIDSTDDSVEMFIAKRSEELGTAGLLDGFDEDMLQAALC